MLNSVKMSSNIFKLVNSVAYFLIFWRYLSQFFYLSTKRFLSCPFNCYFLRKKHFHRYRNFVHRQYHSHRCFSISTAASVMLEFARTFVHLYIIKLHCQWKESVKILLTRKYIVLSRLHKSNSFSEDNIFFILRQIDFIE